MATASEREMIRPLIEEDELPRDRFTSLQPTYEDTVSPEGEDWQQEDSTS